MSGAKIKVLDKRAHMCAWWRERDKCYLVGGGIGSFAFLSSLLGGNTMLLDLYGDILQVKTLSSGFLLGLLNGTC